MLILVEFCCCFEKNYERFHELIFMDEDEEDESGEVRMLLKLEGFCEDVNVMC